MATKIKEDLFRKICSQHKTLAAAITVDGERVISNADFGYSEVTGIAIAEEPIFSIDLYGVKVKPDPGSFVTLQPNKVTVICNGTEIDIEVPKYTKDGKGGLCG